MTRKRARGYTLLELMATLAVAGIVASMAVPSLTTLALNQRRTGVTGDLMLTLLLARSETAKRSRSLVICGVRDTDGDGALKPHEHACAGRDWSDGWLVAAWDDANGDSVVAPWELRVLRVFETGAAGALRITAGNFAASQPVAPPGTLVVKSGRRASNGTLTVCDRRGPAAARAVIVSSFARGRVSATRADGTPLTCP
jgi:type IV fimbrial biogenesis protein FimT